MRDFSLEPLTRGELQSSKNLEAKTIKDLNHVKELLGAISYEDAYARVMDITNDYDNKANNSVYLNDIAGELLTIVYGDDENLSYLIGQCDNDLDRIRCLIGDTYRDSVYSVNAYGNLENVCKDDIEVLIDDLISELNREMEGSVDDE